MGKVKIPYYVVRHGRGYWLATRRMQDLGFPSSVPCGPDGPDAWRIASEWNQKWQAARTGSIVDTASGWPRGSIGEAFDRFRKTNTWATKAQATRAEWEYGWGLISPIFGDLPPSSITLEMLDEWYAGIVDRKSVHAGWRAMKIWRAIWRQALVPLLYVAGADPSAGIRRKTPKGRKQKWREGEIVRIVKAAWRSGYYGLAVCVAIAYDTGLSPVDARSVTMAGLRSDARGAWFEVPRAKTGREALGTLSRRTLRLLDAYFDLRDVEWHPTSPICLNRSWTPYRKDTLTKDFRVIRQALFPGDDRKIMDMRRTMAVETMAGGASEADLASKMANDISTSRTLQRAYLPVSLAQVRVADQARRAGRRRIREND